MLATTEVDANFVDAMQVEYNERITKSRDGVVAAVAWTMSKLHAETERLERDCFKILACPSLRYGRM